MYRTPRDGITSWVYTEVEKVLSRERAISCCITEMTLMRLWQRISEVALQSSPSSRLFESIDIVVVVFNRSLRGPPHRPSAVPPTMVGQAGGQPGRRVVARRRIRHRLCIVVVAWRGVRRCLDRYPATQSIPPYRQNLRCSLVSHLCIIITLPQYVIFPSIAVSWSATQMLLKIVNNLDKAKRSLSVRFVKKTVGA